MDKNIPPPSIAWRHPSFTATLRARGILALLLLRTWLRIKAQVPPALSPVCLLLHSQDDGGTRIHTLVWPLTLFFIQKKGIFPSRKKHHYA